MTPAELWFGRGKTDIGYNRSLKDHPELYDSDVDVIKIAYTGQKAKAICLWPHAILSSVQPGSLIIR